MVVDHNDLARSYEHSCALVGMYAPFRDETKTALRLPSRYGQGGAREAN
jgi:hypothetical protein